MFRDGWGEGIDRYLPLADQLAEPEPLAIEWGPAIVRDHVVNRHGRFLAPDEDLPEPARRGHLLMVAPDAGYDRLAVVMASWNDHGYATREELAIRLARRGIASVIPQNPLYGERRVNANQAIRTVVDFALMTRGAVNEARALLATFHGHASILGVTGYSMGGSLAAITAATAPIPVRAAPLAASYSPAPVFTGGALERAVAWDALGPGGRERLYDVLATADVRTHPPPPLAGRAVLVGADRDGYVPVEATTAIHTHWAGSELRWRSAGHATLLLRRKDDLVDAIADAMV